MPHVKDTRADRAESHFMASTSTFSRWQSHQSLVSIQMPRYQHDREALIIACSRQSVYIQFVLGSLVKCISLYFTGVNYELYFATYPSAFQWMPLKVLQLCYAVGPTARINILLIYLTASVSYVLYDSIRSALQKRQRISEIGNPYGMPIQIGVEGVVYSYSLRVIERPLRKDAIQYMTF